MSNVGQRIQTSEVTVREDASPTSKVTPGQPITPSSEATLIEAVDSATPPPVSLAVGLDIDGWRLREAIKVASGEADLWVASRAKDGQTAVVKVFRWGLRPKAELVEKLRKVPRSQVVEVYSQGVLSDGRHYEVLEHIQHGTLADLGKAGMAPARVKEALKELAEAVAALHDAGILHRDLKPSNVLVRTPKPLDLVLTDFGISSLADLSLHATSANRTAAYSAPEAMTGVVSRASDWWSVGVMVLELLRGAHPFADLDERAINFQLVTRGIEVPPDLPADWALLIKGLLTRDHAKRWGAAQVRSWLEGKRNQAVDYKVAAVADIGQKPYRFQRREYGDASSLAAVLAEKWEEGVKHWARGYVLQWVEKQLEDQDQAIDLHDVQDDKDLGAAELQLAAAVLVMNPDLPLSYKGELVTRDWLGINWEAGRQVLASGLPKWFKHRRQESWLQDAVERWRTGIQFIERLDIQFDGDAAERLLAAGDRATVDELVAERRSKYPKARKPVLAELLKKEPLDFNEAVLLATAGETEFYTVQQLRAEEAALRLREGRQFLRQAQVAVNTETADHLLASGDRTAVDKLVTERRSLSPKARQPIIAQLLDKQQLTFNEAVLLATATEKEFYTRQELLIEETLAWLDQQRVPYNRQKAAVLIDAQSWDVLPPPWEKQRQRAWLAKSPVLEQALTATQPDYRQAVLGAAAEDNAFWTDYYSKGEAYAKGAGVPQNPDEAQHWFSFAAANFRAAAEQGDALSQFNLGVLCKDGKGVPQDHVEAIRWYQLAAAQNFAPAQFALGQCHDLGMGVVVDMGKAVRWYHLAAAHGYPAAQYSLGRCYHLGAGVEQDPKQAVGWYRLAAEQCYANAEFQLAESYAMGIGVPEHRGEAVCWYRRAAKHGQAAAQTALNEMLGYVSNESDGQAIPAREAAAASVSEILGSFPSQVQPDRGPPQRKDPHPKAHIGHQFGSSGVCTLCGRSLEAIRHFGWGCRDLDTQPQSQSEPPTRKPAPPPNPELGHQIGPSGICSICGCTSEAIGHFGWRCRKTESQ